MTGLNLTKSALKAAEKETGNCSATLTDVCVKDIMSTVQRNAAQLSSTDGASANSFRCDTLLDDINLMRISNTSSPCYGLWSETVSTQFLHNNFTTPTPVCSNSDPNFNIGSTNATESGFFAWSADRQTKSGNFTYYDNAIRSPLPLIVATWAKTGVEVGATGWQDTRVMCIPPANTTMSGSRTLAEADKDAGVNAAGRMSTGFGGLVVVGLGMLVLTL